MSTVIKIVGQITLKALTDVKSTTYYYLLQSSMAAAPSKPTTNPPTGGWSTTEPEFFIYMPTQDTTIISGKDYYTRSGEEGSYIYTKVLEPSIDDISNYYEKIYGDTRSLYVTVQTLYTDDTFDYSEPSLSSSYEAAKEAYNRAKTALDLAGDTNQYFWSLSSSYSTDVPAGVYVTHIPQSQFKSTPAQGNVLMQNTGLTIRNGAIALASLTGNALNFYSPTTHNSAVQLSGQALNFYSPSDDRLALSLDSSGLNFYGSSTVNPDASLTLNGLMLKKGGIKAGTDRDNGFVYLSSEDYQLKDATHNGLTINGHTPTAAGTDDKTIDDPAWREIIGTKFGVDSEGNLYANNANLSNATVEGAITATSLTIGSGSDSYNAINAMNAAGYTIEIINDITAAPNNVVINDNSTYLYPIMYHNGIKVESVDIINTQYIWYRGSDTIGIQGDFDNGGMVADYGYTYRVAYSFDDGEVGQAPSVQQVLVDPSKYITRISDIGITIHPEDTSENNYLQIDGNGITIYKNTDSVAQFGTTARIGRINNSRFLINSDSLQGYDSSNVKYFEVSANGLSWGTNGANIAATTSQVASAAQTATNYIKIDGSGIKVQNSTDATDYLFIDSNKIALYRNNVEKIQLTDSLLRLGDISNYINLDINGMDIYRNGESLAQFSINGSRIGAYNAGRIVTSPNELAGYMTNGVRYFTMLENGGEVETYTYMAIWESDIDNSVTIDLSTDQRTRYYWSTVNASEGAIPITFVYHFTNGDPMNGRTRIFNLSITKGTATSNSHFTYDGINTLTILSYKPTVTNPGQWTWTLYGKEISANHITNTTGPFFQFGTDEEELTHTAAYSMSIGKSVSTGPYGLAVGKYNEYHEHDAFSIGGGSNSTYGRYTVFAVDSGGGISAPAYVGLITLVASSTEIPNGWLRCDGDTWEITRYPELYDMIGTNFGTASSGYFKVPTLTAPSGMTYLIYTGRSQTHTIDGIIQS